MTPLSLLAQLKFCLGQNYYQVSQMNQFQIKLHYIYMMYIWQRIKSRNRKWLNRFGVHFMIFVMLALGMMHWHRQAIFKNIWMTSLSDDFFTISSYFAFFFFFYYKWSFYFSIFFNYKWLNLCPLRLSFFINEFHTFFWMTKTIKLINKIN